MRRFDYSFLATGLVPADFVSLAIVITSLKTLADTRKEQFASLFTSLEPMARIQSVKSSNAIEDIVTSDDRIAAIVNKDSAPLNHDEAEIAGYRDAWNEIQLGYDHIQFCQQDILRLHAMLLAIAGDAYGGHYKTSNNVIIEIDAMGNRKVCFTPTPAAETEAAMEQLERAYISAYCDSKIHPLLLIPCVILDFLCIHPFQDGNGRMSRLLSLLLLNKNGYDVGKYASFEEQINKNKWFYYEDLSQSSEGWHDNANSYFPFMRNFLLTLLGCYQDLDRRFAVGHGKRITKKARIEATVLDSLAPISKAEICQILPDVSPTTVEAVLGAMVKDGRIRRIGAASKSRYLRTPE